MVKASFDNAKVIVDKVKKSAKILCQGAANQASYQIADKRAIRSLGCGCSQLGVAAPKG